MNSKSEQKISSSSQLDPRTVLLMDPRADLLPQLLDFDEAQRQRVFDSRVFCCGICFVEKLGSNCLCFKECQHVYCKACMTEYFQIQIRDGNVQCLNCPEPKCTSLATPSQVFVIYESVQLKSNSPYRQRLPCFPFLSAFMFQVKQLVDEELFARYDRLLLQSSLDLMADVVYCPRQSCGTAVMMEPDTTMGICSACQYAFCTLCKLGYHGVSHCKIRAGNATETLIVFFRSKSDWSVNSTYKFCSRNQKVSNIKMLSLSTRFCTLVWRFLCLKTCHQHIFMFKPVFCFVLFFSLQRNCVTWETSTCLLLLQGKSSWSNAMGKGWSRKQLRSPLAETGSVRTANAARAVEPIYRLGFPC